MTPQTAKDTILIIKLSALGDFVLAFNAFQAIRQAHRDARIVLLTTAPYAPMATRSPWFDDVWIDQRPKLWHPLAILKLRRLLRQGGFRRVYDLQTSDRSSWYFRLMGGRRTVEWCGHIPGCSHPQTGPDRRRMHTIERHVDQLRRAGVEATSPPETGWLTADIQHFNLKQPFCLLLPGGSAHRPEKRWPASHYAGLAQVLDKQGITPVILGTRTEAAEGKIIQSRCPEAHNLIGRTSLEELAELARHAWGAAGNDTGPMHLISVTGCPSVALYSHASNPMLCGQRGPYVRILQRERLSTLMVADVSTALADIVEERNQAQP